MIPALVTAIAGVILSGYLYFAPLYSFQVASPQEALNLMLFTVVAVVVSHLSSQAKRHILIAQKREREVSDLYAFSRRLAIDVYKRQAMARATAPIFSPSCGSTRITIGPGVSTQRLVLSVPAPGIAPPRAGIANGPQKRQRIALNVGFLPVSYTHLDVYKRQM